MNIILDMGTNSDGWTVGENVKNELFPSFVGAGSYLMPEGLCLAKSRGAYRRMRKQIASRRNRIARLRKVLLSMEVLTKDELDNFKEDAPWYLAAKVLVTNGSFKLSWAQLWSVIRWYAHNRGYDGNRAWANSYLDLLASSKEENIEVSDEFLADIKRCESAKEMMKKYGTSTMAESVCAYLKIDSHKDLPKTWKGYFKGENVAFPRDVIKGELKKILEFHKGVLSKCDDAFVELIVGNWRTVNSYGIKLPARFTNDQGLLFGQLLPRFDNRIISKCPISGEKVPSKHDRFVQKFRWLSLVSNIRVREETGETRALNASEISKLDAKMEVYGSFTKTTLTSVFDEIFPNLSTNLEALVFTEEFENSLVGDPVKRNILKVICQNIGRNLPNEEDVKTLWSLIPKFVYGNIFKGRAYSLKDISELKGVDSVQLKTLCEKIFVSSSPKTKSKKSQENAKTIEDVWTAKIFIEKEKGRAAYARKIIKKACEEIYSGKDPRSEGGALYKTAEMEEAILKESIDTWTNNHLVRHRLKMLIRLLDDIIKRYAGGDKTKVESITIEVAKDMAKFSGLESKEKQAKINEILKQHKNVSENLKNTFKEENIVEEINAGLIRKARIADDMGWICPFTGDTYRASDLPKLEKEHIIPRSIRPSDSLESLVLTWKAVNDFKGDRTAYEFVKEFQGQPVPGLRNKTIVSLNRYVEFVKSLGLSKNCSKEDKKRIDARKRLMLTESYNPRKSEFLPSDLTQTSHINKLAFRAIKQYYLGSNYLPKLIHVAGSVTGAIRKNWNLMDTLSKICPEVLEEVTDNKGQTKKVLRNKTEIRSITHLHHAVDAITLGIATKVFPTTKEFYEAILKRKPTAKEKALLKSTGLFEFDSEGKWHLIDIPKHVLENIEKCLGECRVITHKPAKMSGLKVEETLWRVVGIDEKGKVKIRQKTNLKKPTEKQRRETKTDSEVPAKLLGYTDDKQHLTKLSRNKAVFVINENFGVVLDPTPEIVVFHNVWKKLQEYKQKNGDKMPRIIRKNDIIKVEKGGYAGVWMVKSTKNDLKKGLVLDLIAPFKCENGKRDVRLKTLLKDGLTIMKQRPTGID